MRVNPDPAKGRADMFRFLSFSAARPRSRFGRDAREAADRRALMGETWSAIVCFFVCVAVAASVSVWANPPDGTGTPPDAPIATAVN
jgi:hypothetical protein